MKIEHILSLITLFSFFAYLVKRGATRKDYLLFVLYVIPFMDLPVTPVEYGRLRIFDIITYISLFIMFRDVVLVKIKNAYNVYYVLFCCLIAAVFFSALNALFIRQSLMAIISILPIFIYAKSLITECTADDGFQKEVIKSLKVGALISIGFLVVQLVIGLKFNFYPALNINTTLYGANRYPSFFHDPQKYGQYLMMLSFLFLVNYKNDKRPELVNYLFFALILFGILQTGGRTALIGLCAGMVILFFVLGTKYRVIFLSLSLAGVLVIAFFSDSLLVFNRAKNIDDDYLFRAALWEEAYKYWADKPMLGIGLGNYEKYAVSFSNNYYKDPDNEIIFFDQPESGPLMILSEMGVLGATIIALFFLIPVFSGIRNYIFNNRNVIIFLFIAGILGWLLTFVPIYSLGDRRIMIVVVSLLSMLIVESNRKEEYEV
ncbi:O-antigen ligase domain-containing protein [Pedobacter frigidisoli]|uniref:O-antigen ligase domain-containing protein n=1 Tax=Pedobacter frigidisoli TaxID=2530455 RepID=A0A4R0NMQ8_9SPHI|nr:O-antigen ligase family protein [Pedobacter frigidisoli]TCD01976.1 O-antigen ligase domain-containing protein [Pedobacter frigidisoli]